MFFVLSFPRQGFQLCRSWDSWRVGKAKNESEKGFASGLMLVTAAESLSCALTRTVIFIFTVVFPCGSTEKAEESHPFPRAGHTLALHTLPLV